MTEILGFHACLSQVYRSIATEAAIDFQNSIEHPQGNIGVCLNKKLLSVVSIEMNMIIYTCTVYAATNWIHYDKVH